MNRTYEDIIRDWDSSFLNGGSPVTANTMTMVSHIQAYRTFKTVSDASIFLRGEPLENPVIGGITYSVQVKGGELITITNDTSLNDGAYFLKPDGFYDASADTSFEPRVIMKHLTDTSYVEYMISNIDGTSLTYPANDYSIPYILDGSWNNISPNSITTENTSYILQAVKNQDSSILFDWIPVSTNGGINIHSVETTDQSSTSIPNYQTIGGNTDLTDRTIYAAFANTNSDETVDDLYIDVSALQVQYSSTDGIKINLGGDLITEGESVNTSDIRYKNVISSVVVTPEDTAKISKIKFSWKNDLNNVPHIGVSAQSVEEIYPELVYTNPKTGKKAVNYNGLSVIALSAIDSLSKRLDMIEDKLKNL